MFQYLFMQDIAQVSVFFTITIAIHPMKQDKVR